MIKDVPAGRAKMAGDLELVGIVCDGLADRFKISTQHQVPTHIIPRLVSRSVKVEVCEKASSQRLRGREGSRGQRQSTTACLPLQHLYGGFQHPTVINPHMHKLTVNSTGASCLDAGVNLPDCATNSSTETDTGQQMALIGRQAPSFAYPDTIDYCSRRRDSLKTHYYSRRISWEVDIPP